MVPAVTDQQARLAPLCERFGVQRLEIFGSGATDDQFDLARSDLDFIVEFRPDQI